MHLIVRLQTLLMGEGGVWNGENTRRQRKSKEGCNYDDLCLCSLSLPTSHFFPSVCPCLIVHLSHLADTVISLCHAEFLDMKQRCIDVLLTKYKEVDLWSWVWLGCTRMGFLVSCLGKNCNHKKCLENCRVMPHIVAYIYAHASSVCPMC
jgi:hypothetical protein